MYTFQNRKKKKKKSAPNQNRKNGKDREKKNNVPCYPQIFEIRPVRRENRPTKLGCLRKIPNIYTFENGIFSFFETIRGHMISFNLKIVQSNQIEF